MASPKKLGAKCESYNKLKNSFLKITQLSPWQITEHFFARCVIFLRHHFLWASCLCTSGGVYIMCHFYKVPLFSNSIKGCLFCWVSFLLSLSNGAVVFIAICIKEYSLGLSNCNYFLFYQ